MKKKILTFISFVLVFCQLLPVCTGAVDTLDIYPTIYFYKFGDEQPIDSNFNLQLYQTTSQPTTFDYLRSGNQPLPDKNVSMDYGILFPINNITNIEGGSETYIVNFTLQIRPNNVRLNTDQIADIALSKFVVNYGENDSVIYQTQKLPQGHYQIETSDGSIQAYYKCTYSDYFVDSSYDNDEDYYNGIYNLHFTLLLNLNNSSSINNVFFNLDFYDLVDKYDNLLFIIQPCTTSSYVVSDLDDIDTELTNLSGLINSIYTYLYYIYESSSFDGGMTINLLNKIFEQDKVSFENIENGVTLMKQQVQQLEDKMDEKVEEGLESFKENIKQEVEAEVDKAIQDILGKVDVVDTSAAQDAFTTLYNVITTDSKNAVLTVPAFKLDLFGSQYVLWDSFTFDIPALVETMGADQYLVWLRFTFFFGFGWFLYGRANRMISIILLDDVHEQQANIRSEQEYWRRRNGKR